MTEDIQMPNGDFLKNYPEVTRVEVINGSERELVRYECSDVQVSLQDDGQTLKPNNIIEKDINDMVLSGLDVQSVIELNTYSGLEAKLKFTTWRKI